MTKRAFINDITSAYHFIKSKGSIVWGGFYGGNRFHVTRSRNIPKASALSKNTLRVVVGVKKLYFQHLSPSFIG